MSTRSLRRATTQQTADDEETSSSEDEHAPTTSAGPPNPFTLLAEDEEDADEADDGAEDARSAEPRQEALPGVPTQSASSSEETTKLRRGKKREPLQQSNESKPEENILELETAPQPQQPTAVPPNPPSPTRDTLLCISDPRRLNESAEVRRLFGGRLFTGLGRRRGSASGSSSFTRRMQALRLQGIREVPSTFVDAKDHWPLWRGTYSLEHVGTDPSSCVKHFRLSFSKSYSECQALFERAVESGDPSNFNAVLATEPNHLGALLALSNVKRHLGDLAESQDLLQRAVFSLQSSFPVTFSPWRGNCRIDFSDSDNAIIYKILFKHCLDLSRRGCSATALNIARILLSLDEDDPAGISLAVDNFAIRAGEYQWLLDFIQFRCPHALQPNFAYARPLAKLFLYKSRKADAEEKAAHIYCLARAILLYPEIVQYLNDKGSFATNVPLTALINSGQLQKHISHNRSISQLSKIHVERNYDLYRSPQICDWFKEALRVLSERQQIVEGNLMDSTVRAWLKVDCARTRLEAFDGGENYYRHLDHSDFSDSNQAIQEENDMEADNRADIPDVAAPAPVLPAASNTWLRKFLRNAVEYPPVHFVVSMFFDV